MTNAERPLTRMQAAEAAYAALQVTRKLSGSRLPDWEMLRDDDRIAFCEAGADSPALHSDRDVAVVAAVLGALL